MSSVMPGPALGGKGADNPQMQLLGMTQLTKEPNGTWNKYTWVLTPIWE
jgi:hypothetical protein